MNNGIREPPIRHSGDFFILSYKTKPPKPSMLTPCYKKSGRFQHRLQIGEFTEEDFLIDFYSLRMSGQNLKNLVVSL